MTVPVPAPVPSVGVLVDLFRAADAGGHVKCWERFAAAATRFPDEVDLTVYYLGEHESSDRLAGNVRIVTLPPVLSTSGVPALSRTVGATDVAPYHRRLAGHLPRHDIFHVTDAFAFGRTARRVGRRLRRPLVGSVHTDLAKFTRIYSRAVIGRALGGGTVGPALVDRFRLDQRCASVARASWRHLLADCAHVLASNDDDLRWLRTEVVPARHASRLRRGIDAELFHPRQRDRAWLQSRFGVPADAVVVVFAGRVDASKRPVLVGQAVRRLRAAGHDVHLLVAGAGTDRERIRAELGRHVTLPGVLPQAELARVMASGDVFAFPSCTETIGNVVAEAMAAGLPPVVQAGQATNQWLAAPGRDGLVVAGDDAEAWAAALLPLVTDPRRRRAVAAAARATVEQRHPSWADVLEDDLLPAWHDVYAEWFRRPAMRIVAGSAWATGAVPARPARAARSEARSAANGTSP